jgi:16S rRNA (uracil1498-N3)-methyltransferase
MARTWRIHHPELPAFAGASFDLTGDEARHAVRVLRLRAGERIAVFDGRGSEWHAAIERCDRGRVTVKLETPVTGVVDPALEIVLFQGLCKPDPMAWLVQKATEVGISAVLPFISGRAGRLAVTEQRLARWRRIAVEACKQSGRRRVPRVEVCQALPVPPTPGPLGLLLDPEPGAMPLADHCAALAGPPRSVWLAVGPEGGFAPGEVASWVEQGWRRAGLGPRTLRADTAGLVAASILLHRWSDLGSGSAEGDGC